MKIFQQEKTDGLQETIQTNSSIAYVSQLCEARPSDEKKSKIIAQLELSANKKNQQDLYYMDSVLVTTCWNNNDDVFNKNEVWKARKTPEDKPFNIEHDEHHIIGHITGNWPIGLNGQSISETSDENNLPDVFHIVTSSVIYKHWTDPELVGRTEELIGQIEAGNKFVSMECLFTGFDYALKSEGGDKHILSRNEESAFLTKHLRAYGGGGVYEGYKVGRLLRNIAFCGHGLVDRPANPSSIIFDKYNPFTAPSEGSLKIFLPPMVAQSSSIKETKMTEVNVDFYKAQIDELKASVESLSKTKTDLEDKLAAAGTKEYEARIEEMEAEAEANLAQSEALKSEITKLQAELSEAQSKVEEAEAKLQEEQSSKAALQGQLDAIETEKVRANRIAKLVDSGFEPEMAEEAIDKFADLNDEQFDTIALMVAPQPTEEQEAEETVAEDSSEEDITEDAAEAAADEVDLDEVETSEEVALSACSECDEVEDTRAALSELISQKFLNVN